MDGFKDLAKQTSNLKHLKISNNQVSTMYNNWPRQTDWLDWLYFIISAECAIGMVWGAAGC